MNFDGLVSDAQAAVLRANPGLDPDNYGKAAVDVAGGTLVSFASYADTGTWAECGMAFTSPHLVIKVLCTIGERNRLNPKVVYESTVEIVSGSPGGIKAANVTYRRLLKALGVPFYRRLMADKLR